MTERPRSLRARLHGWPYYKDGMVNVDRAIDEVAEWLRDEAGDIEAEHSGEPGAQHEPIVQHLRYLADLAEEP